MVRQNKAKREASCTGSGGGSFLWRAARQSKLPQPKEITQGQEQSHVARWWQAEPAVMLTVSSCCGGSALDPAPSSHLGTLGTSLDSWSQLICQTQDLSLSPASTKSQCSNTWPRRRCDYVDMPLLVGPLATRPHPLRSLTGEG